MVPPNPPEGLYDKDLSQASLAAAQAIADLQEKPEPWSGIAPHDHLAPSSNGELLLQDSLVALPPPPPPPPPGQPNLF